MLSLNHYKGVIVIKLVDLTGCKFGKLSVIERADNRRNRVHWLCECDCGKRVIVQSSQLRTGHTRSCGCLLDGSFNIAHGMTHTRLYRMWATMKQRCCDPNSSGYYKYGAKGVTVCEDWKFFEPFMKWALSNGYTDKLSIDRIDNSKGYCPENCRFVTMRDQQNNRTNNVYIEIDGTVHTLAEWCRIYDLKYSIVQHRIQRRKLSHKDAILTVLAEKKKLI